MRGIHVCACLPSDLNPIFCVRLFVFVFRLMDVEHSQPPTHTLIHTHTHIRTNWSDGSGSERAMHAKGRRTQSLRQKGVAAAVRALLLLLLLSRKNNKCINTLRTHTKVPMLKWDLLLLYAITVAFFLSTTLPTSCNVNNFTTFHIEITEITHTHTRRHTLCPCMQFSLFAVGTIRHLQASVVYVCACVLCVTACMCV